MKHDSSLTATIQRTINCLSNVSVDAQRENLLVDRRHCRLVAVESFSVGFSWLKIFLWPFLLRYDVQVRALLHTCISFLLARFRHLLVFVYLFYFISYLYCVSSAIFIHVYLKAFNILGLEFPDPLHILCSHYKGEYLCSLHNQKHINLHASDLGWALRDELDSLRYRRRCPGQAMFACGRCHFSASYCVRPWGSLSGRLMV